MDIIPILKTQNNIALMASSLAIIFNPKKIYYLGVDLDEQPHFYELDDYYYNAQCALEQSPRFKANSNLAGIDHEYDNYFVTTNLMTHLYESKQKTTEENSNPKRHNTKTPFIVNGVLEAFNNIYKKYYDDNKIEYYVLTKNSRLSEIGFNYHEL